MVMDARPTRRAFCYPSGVIAVGLMPGSDPGRLLKVGEGAGKLGSRVGVSVGGTDVAVAVGLAGTSVHVDVGVGESVAVGGGGVLVAVGTRVAVGVAVPSCSQSTSMRARSPRS